MSTRAWYCCLCQQSNLTILDSFCPYCKHRKCGYCRYELQSGGIPDWGEYRVLSKSFEDHGTSTRYGGGGHLQRHREKHEGKTNQGTESPITDRSPGPRHPLRFMNLSHGKPPHQSNIRGRPPSEDQDSLIRYETGSYLQRDRDKHKEEPNQGADPLITDHSLSSRHPLRFINFSYENPLHRRRSIRFRPRSKDHDSPIKHEIGSYLQRHRDIQRKCHTSKLSDLFRTNL